MKNISQHLCKIQAVLFPFLEEHLGPHTKLHEKLVTIIDFARPELFIRRYDGAVGRPLEDRASIARSYIAKAVYNLPTTVALIDRLNCDAIMRRICGYERKKDIPSESTFSRAFAKFADTELPSLIHAAFVKACHSEDLLWHVSIDSTAIEAREKAIKTEKKEESKKEPQKKKKRGRPKKGEIVEPKEPTRLEEQQNMGLNQMITDLPKKCDIGCKKDSKGYKITWRGYKLHIATSDGDIPISAILTSASCHDSQVALPLARMTEQRVTHLYDLMDAAYDAEIIRKDSENSGRVALIDFNRRSPKDKRQFVPHEKERYKERSAAERVNSNLKDNFGGRMIRVRGASKVLAHLMFGILALTIDQTIRFATP